jgi:SagB-type dehydrogenase family enzyme
MIRMLKGERPHYSYKIGCVILMAIIFLIGKEDSVMAKTKEIQLPQPLTKGKLSLEETIAGRRSQRNFRDKNLSLEQISQILWAAQGITGKSGGFSFRAAPSAGALYPMEIYLLTPEGLYHYFPETHRLEVLGEKDLRRGLAESALGQEAVARAPLDIVICSVYERVKVKYGERGIRYAHIEAGHIAQNIHLEAVALGLGSVPIGAFNDKAVKEYLLLPADCEPLYIIPVGYPE